MKFLVPIDLAQNELRFARVHYLTEEPAAPVEGQIYFDSTEQSLFVFTSGGWVDLKAIDDLSVGELEDVTITTPAGDEFLVYDSGTGKWVNTTRDLEDLQNVIFTNPAAGEVVYFDGTNWVNHVPSLDEFAAAADDLDLGGNKITNLDTPSADTDAATKGYVDGVAQGLDVKLSVRAATTGPVTLSGEQTVDGVGLVAGDRVLVKNQPDASENGIYVVASGAWSRADDAATTADLTSGAFTFVEEGTVNDDTGWVLSTNEPTVVGDSDLVWVQFSGAGTYLAGTGLTLTGNTFSITPGGVTATELADNAVVTAKILDGNVTEAKLDATLASKINAKTDVASATIGNGSATSITVNHNLNSRDVQVHVYEADSPYAQVFADVEHTNNNSITLKFAVAPAQDEYRVVVVG